MLSLRETDDRCLRMTHRPDYGHSPRMSEPRLDWHLWNWEQWQLRSHFGSLRAHWYPAVGAEGPGAGTLNDFDDMVSAVDGRCAQAVESALEGCTVAERAAVHHKHLHAVYRLREPLEDCYARARCVIRATLDRRGIV